MSESWLATHAIQEADILLVEAYYQVRQGVSEEVWSW